MITTELLTHIESLKQQIPEVSKDAIFENADYIISLLQTQQLSKGQDSYGNYVGFYKTVTQDYYAQDPYNKPRKPKNSGQAYNFEWTGEFFDSMNIKVDSSNTDYEIFSSTGKDKFLESIYKTELTKLSKDTNDWVNKNILEPYISSWMSAELLNMF